MNFDQAVEQVRSGQRDAVDSARDLVAQLDDRERLGLLDGDQGFWRGVVDMALHGYNHEPLIAGAVPRLGIPGIRFTDGPRGIVMGHSTCFPVAMARGASWDVELEEEIGQAIGAEGRAQGANLFAGVCINLLRHPAWGRAQETYGEDPVLLGNMGAALTRGVRRHLMACVKHFALNSMENARFVVDVRVDDESLHEVYLPHFKEVLDAGAEAVMSAYNSVNGEWCGDSPHLLTRILRDEWNFPGFVMSDFIFGHRDPVGSIKAGLDLEMPFRQQRRRRLPKALADGSLARVDVEKACIRLVAAQLTYASRLTDLPPDRHVVACGQHRALARRAASQAMVLLRNEQVDGTPLLPLEPSRLSRVAVIGRLATTASLGDKGSSDVRPPDVVTPLQAIRAALAGVAVDAEDGSDVHAATRLAGECDVAVVVVGFTYRDEGEAVVAATDSAISVMPPPVGLPIVSSLASEVLGAMAKYRIVPGGDRERLTLRPQDERLIQSVSAVNRRTIVVLIAGSAVIMENWRERVPAILLAWYPGMEGGNALADVLFGSREPGGRLPFAIPREAGDLPTFEANARSVVYDRWWGQRKLDRDGRTAAYPFGFGIGYTSFSLSSLEIEQIDVGTRRASVAVEVRNTGKRKGGAVVQVYVDALSVDPNEFPKRQLVGFQRVVLEVGEARRIRIEASLQPLARRQEATRVWSLRAGSYRFVAAQFSSDPSAIELSFDL